MKTDLTKFDACQDAVMWFKQFDTDRDAWNACHRGDWMLWIAIRLGVDIHLLTLASGRCAETVIHLMNDQRSVDAVKAAIAFGEGKITEDELRMAAYAARSATYAAAYDAAATYAAHAARKKNQLTTANICREVLTDAVFDKLNQLNQQQ